MQKFSRFFLVIGGVFGALGIIMGAVGAHALKGSSDPTDYEGVLTGTRYHMIHAILIVVLGFFMEKRPNSLFLFLAGCAAVLGVLFFSGSLYIMAFSSDSLGWLTPIGGLLLISSWLLIAIQFLIKPKA